MIELKLLDYIPNSRKCEVLRLFFLSFLFLARAVSDCLKAKFSFERILVLLFFSPFYFLVLPDPS